MNGSIGFFDKAAVVGSRILKYLGGSEGIPKLKEYLELVARIYESLADIHDRVSDVVIDVSLATNMNDAIQAMQGLNQMGLKDALKAQEMCDELEQMGMEIKPLFLSLDDLDNDTKIFLEELSEQLIERELGTARLYDEKLYELKILPHSEPSLEALKAKVEDISKQLVIQKGSFDFLAKKARAMLKQVQ